MQTRTQNQKHFISRQSLIDFICYAIILVMVYAAVFKLLDYNKFLKSLHQSPIIGEYNQVLAWLVPSVEILISALLLYKPSRLIGLCGAFVLLVGFTVYIAYLLTFAPMVPCSCGGILSTMGWKAHLWFNSVLTVLCAIGIVLEKKIN